MTGARSRSGRSRRNRGFILLPVIFALALLAVMALTLTRTVAVDIRSAAIEARRAEAEMIADGIARLAILNLIGGRSADPRGRVLQSDGTPFACAVGRTVAVVSVQDTGGQVDLNLAPLELLELLLVAVDVAKDEAARIAAAIVDYRDADDVTLPGGAELAEYRAAGLSYGPKNAPFASVGELDQVLGMTPALLARLRPLVTVNSGGRGGVDQTTAAAGIRGLRLSAAQTTASAGRAFRVQAAVRTAARGHFTRELVVELSPRAPSGHLIRHWTQGELVAAQGVAGDLPLCLDALLKSDQ